MSSKEILSNLAIAVLNAVVLKSPEILIVQALCMMTKHYAVAGGPVYVFQKLIGTSLSTILLFFAPPCKSKQR